MRVSSVSRLASGFDCTSNAPEFARSFEVPLCKAVFNHFTSDGLPACRLYYVLKSIEYTKYQFKCGFLISNFVTYVFQMTLLVLHSIFGNYL